RNLSVFENVRVAVQARSRYRRSPWRDAEALGEVVGRAWDLLETVGLEPRAAEEAATLSHGEQRLLEIAITLATEPEVLLLDEPLAGLADAERERISALVRHLAGRHTILLIEHDIDRVLSLSDRITVLHQGRVIAEGAPADVVSQPQVITAYLGRHAEAQPAGPARAPAVPAAAAPLLRLDGINAGYGGSRILHDVSLEVREGEIVALLGRNGVGKTTTLRTIMGAPRPASGPIAVRGAGLARGAPRRANRPRAPAPPLRPRAHPDRRAEGGPDAPPGRPRLRDGERARRLRGGRRGPSPGRGPAGPPARRVAPRRAARGGGPASPQRKLARTGPNGANLD